MAVNAEKVPWRYRGNLNKVVVLQKNREGNMNETCAQRGSFKENGNEEDTFAQDQKEAEIFGTHNGERKLGESDIY